MFQLFHSKRKTLPMSQAKTELQQNPQIVLIDVRTPEEYKSGHIPGSTNVPLDRAYDIEQYVKDKNAKIFVYCLSGGRSQSACDIFAKLGYQDVTNIGGITSWDGKVERSTNQ